MNVAAWILDAARRHAQCCRFETQRVALVSADEALDYAQLEARVAAMVKGLSARGVQPGDRVGLLADGSPDVVAAWLAVVARGATVVPLSTRATAAEVARDAERVALRLLLVDQAHVAEHGAELESLRLDRLFDPQAEPVDDPELQAVPAPDGVAMLLFTSGTTRDARIVRIGHRALLRHTQALAGTPERPGVLGLGPDDVVLATLPLAHSFGIRMTALAPLAVGARVEIEPDFDASRSIDRCRRAGVTWMAGVPTMFARWAEVEGRPWGTLKWALSAGAPLTEDVRLRAERRLGAPVRQGYGLTEATFCTLDAPPAPPAPGTVGRPVPGVELRVEAGEVLVRGDNLMDGYEGEPPFEGWLRTGDLGHVDSEGRLTLVGRAKDLILRGGHNVHPAEVEDVVASYPGVREVAVVGRPDAVLGEEVVAVVVADATFDRSGLDAFLRARLSGSKRPRECVEVEALPVGRSQKVLRRMLREQLIRGALVATRLHR